MFRIRFRNVWKVVATFGKKISHFLIRNKSFWFRNIRKSMNSKSIWWICERLCVPLTIFKSWPGLSEENAGRAHISLPDCHVERVVSRLVHRGKVYPVTEQHARNLRQVRLSRQVQPCLTAQRPLLGDEAMVNMVPTSVADPDPNPDPSDPYVFGPPGSWSGSISQRYGSESGSFYHQAKVVRKILIPTALWLLFDFLSLKNDVNVPSKTNKYPEGQWRKSDPLVIGKISRIKIRIRIHTKMSWIRNTGTHTLSNYIPIRGVDPQL